MRQRHFQTVASLMLAIVVAFGEVMPSSAAPPSNDDFASATAVTEPLPFSDATSTGEATTAADDPDCYGNGPTVWYAFTPSQDIYIRADTFGSDYDTTLSVYMGSPGNLLQIACNDDSASLQSLVTFNAVANETYYLMVGAFGSGSGGNLVLTVGEFEPLNVEFRVNGSGSFDRAGNAIIRGTVTCSRLAYIEMAGDVQQSVGRRVIRGASGVFIECNGETAWDMFISGQNGRFAGGPAQVYMVGTAYDSISGEGIWLEAAAVVHLKKK